MMFFDMHVRMSSMFNLEIPAGGKNIDNYFVAFPELLQMHLTTNWFKSQGGRRAGCHNFNDLQGIKRLNEI